MTFLCDVKMYSVTVQFPDETLRSGELLNMIVAVIDSTQVINLIGASPLRWLGNHVSSVCVCVCAVTGADVSRDDGEPGDVPERFCAQHPQ